MDPDAYFAAMDLRGFELLIVAPPGTGASSRPSAPDGYKMADYVADLESLRVHLVVNQLTLYGNSHGGCVALAWSRVCRRGRGKSRLQRGRDRVPARLSAAVDAAVA
jgi:pimeloyl-ACP methyl ester carboxylesterase